MSLLLIEKEDRVLHVTLNRPGKRNAINMAMCQELIQVLEEVQTDAAIGSVLLDAAGRVFCAGVDLDEAAASPTRENLAPYEKLFSIGRCSKKPIVACVNGPALSTGVGLVAQTHVAVAAQGALFGLPEIRTGTWPFIIFRSVEAAIGARRTLELSLTGRLFSAQEALAWGLIHQTAHAFEVEDRAGAIARDLAKASPDAVRFGFEYFHRSRNKTWDEVAETVLDLRQQCNAAPDFREGVAAFHKHREPHWPSMPSGTYTEAPEPVPGGNNSPAARE
jgi:enoyl-CoA hydratase/carnithine racemase